MFDYKAKKGNKHNIWTYGTQFNTIYSDTGGFCVVDARSARHWGRNSKAMYRLVRSIMTVFGLRKRRREATLIRFMPNQKI